MKKCITVFTIYLVLVILVTGTVILVKNKSKSNENSSTITTESDIDESNDSSDVLDTREETDTEGETDEDVSIEIGEPIYTFDSKMPSDIYGTYSQDDLEITYEQTNVCGRDVEMPHIVGLKNKEVEDNIENEIMSTMQEMLESGREPIYAYCNVYSSFANTLSVVCNVTYENGFEDYSTDVRCLNYNLVTGEKIYLDDLFVDDVNMARVFYTTLYDSMVVDNYYEDTEAFYNEHQDDDEYFDDENYVGHADEEEILRDVKKYLSLPIEDIEFVFTEEYALLYDYKGTGLCYTLRYEKVKDLVNIYNKYETGENIFEEEFKDAGQDGVFNFTVYRPYDNCEMFGFVSDNVFVDFTSVDRGNEFYGLEKTVDDRYFEIYEESLSEEYAYVNEMIEKAKSDKDHIYFVFDSIESDISTESNYDSETDIWDYELTNLMSIRTYRNTYVIPVDEYETSVKGETPYRDRLIYAYKEHMAFAFEKKLEYVYDDEWNLVAEPYSTEEQSSHFYLYDTGEEITELPQFFNTDDYMTEIYYAILCDEDYDDLGYLDLEDELINHSEMTFDGYGISVVLLNHPDCYIFISYDELDKSALKIKLMD